MQIRKLVPGERGIAAADGVENEVNLCLLEDAREGDYVIVHAGFAIEKLDEAEAQARLELFDELAEAMRQ